MKDLVSLVGRVLLAVIFLLSGAHKIIDLAGTQSYMAAMGMPMTGLFVWGAIVVEILGGLSLLVGCKFRSGAALLALYLIPVTWIFHRNFADPMQMIQFLKNLAILGGLCLAATSGPGRFSCDAHCGSCRTG